MPQNNIFLPATLSGGTKSVPLKVDAFGNMQATNGGIKQSYNITAATVVKAAPGRLAFVSVLVAGAAGAVYDSISTSGNSAANEVFVIPAAVGIYYLDWPLATGLVVAPGAAQVVAISYS